MVIRFKDAVIDSIGETETRRLKLLKVSSKSDSATLTLELPDALCDSLNSNDLVNVIIDSKPIAKGTQAKIYVQGSVFKKMGKDDLEIVGSIGGLRLVLSIAKATTSQSTTFNSDTFFLAII